MPSIISFSTIFILANAINGPALLGNKEAISNNSFSNRIPKFKESVISTIFRRISSLFGSMR